MVEYDETCFTQDYYGYHETPSSLGGFRGLIEPDTLYKRPRFNPFLGREGSIVAVEKKYRDNPKTPFLVDTISFVTREDYRWGFRDIYNIVLSPTYFASDTLIVQVSSDTGTYDGTVNVTDAFSCADSQLPTGDITTERLTRTDFINKRREDIKSIRAIPDTRITQHIWDDF